ncbi:uroporphyrinogen-III synthase [Marinimicrobium sp. C2-29]|uniref:uroporphyrinogen-III synthase n=1 Tax=Marinimicrobium sp. C2-29 TaxID=3139825 RepID=UPI003138C3CB
MAGLEGLRVLITRPEPQAQAWARTLAGQGAEPIAVPMMALEALTEPAEKQAIKNIILDFDLYQKAIFVSQNAVAYALEWLEDYWPQLPIGIEYFAVGERTAEALREHGIEVTALQSRGAMNSEALLRSAPLQQEQVEEQRIVIFRGRGGRGILGETLQTRGARVHYCELYQRVVPTGAAERLDRALTDASAEPLIVALHSGETLENYAQTLAQLPIDGPARRTLARAPILVPGERVAQQAKTLGFTRVFIAENATDPSMLDALHQAVNDPALLQTNGTLDRD